MEKPEILNEPQDLILDCLSQVPTPEPLQIQDNCDINPKVVFDEKRNFRSVCDLELIRTWVVTDQCNNSSSTKQTIIVTDLTAPEFTKLPQNKIVHCQSNILEEFQNFLKNSGNAMAIDNCSNVKYSNSFDTLGLRPCDSTLVDFLIEDEYKGH